MNQYKLYIGAHNVTKEVDVVGLCTILDGHFSGYTIIDAMGRWEGDSEKSVFVDIITEKNAVDMKAIINTLCRALEQNCIIVAMSQNVDIRFITK